MRIIIFASLLFMACESHYEISFSAIKDSAVYNFDNSITIKEFIGKTDSLKCHGYSIVGNSYGTEDVNYLVLSKCTFPSQMKMIYYDGIQLPIYKCNGFRKYGVNLCEGRLSTYKKLKEFYLNPTSRADYPQNPTKARLKIVVEESMTINSIIPKIKMIKSIRDQIQNGILSNLPLSFSLETIQRDSILIKSPEFEN